MLHRDNYTLAVESRRVVSDVFKHGRSRPLTPVGKQRLENKKTIALASPSSGGRGKKKGRKKREQNERNCEHLKKRPLYRVRPFNRKIIIIMTERFIRRSTGNKETQIGMSRTNLLSSPSSPLFRPLRSSITSLTCK